MIIFSGFSEIHHSITLHLPIAHWVSGDFVGYSGAIQGVSGVLRGVPGSFVGELGAVQGQFRVSKRNVGKMRRPTVL